MFAPPARRATEVYARLPDALRMPGRSGGSPHGRLGNTTRDSFLEGPSFDRAGNLWCVDIVYGRILHVDTEGNFSVAAQWEGEPNGLKVHRDGSLWIADYVRGLLRLMPGAAEAEVVCAGPGPGERFNGLNDLVFAPNGDLYFTDQGPSDLIDPHGRIFRLRAGSTTPELLVANLPSPNGLVITPDNKWLIFAVTKANAVWRVPLRSDGGVGRVGLFLQLSGSAGGGPDGLAIDAAGNLAVAHPLMAAVWLFSVRGEPLLRIDSCTGDTTTNLCFGGPDNRDLYITESASGTILRCRGLPEPGLRMYSHT